MNILTGSIKFSGNATSGTPLITVSGGEIEARYISFIHGGGSKGAFFNISKSGVVVLNESQISFDSQVGYVF
jgi:hypothetical protein